MRVIIIIFLLFLFYVIPMIFCFFLGGFFFSILADCSNYSKPKRNRYDDNEDDNDGQDDIVCFEYLSRSCVNIRKKKKKYLNDSTYDHFQKKPVFVHVIFGGSSKNTFCLLFIYPLVIGND